jgi:WD40 repeat protein
VAQYRIDDKVTEANKKHFERNRDYLASASDDRTIKIWDLDTFECLKTFDTILRQRINCISRWRWKD